MQYKQAQAVLSDVLLKCEDECVALPADPLDAVLAAMRALSRETKHEVGRPQIEAAIQSMCAQFGIRDQKDASTERDAKDEEASTGTTISPRGRKRSAHSESKSKLDVLSKPAKHSENQQLVEQLVRLGEVELKSGHTQRGVARMRAARQLRDADEVITSGAQARHLDRVGASAAAKIDAILHGGLEDALREYENE